MTPGLKALGSARGPLCHVAALDAATWLGLAVAWLGPLLAWRFLPAAIPVHFDLAGAPDAWAGRAWLFLPPLLGTPPLVLLQAFVRHRDPRAGALHAVAVSLFRWMAAEGAWLVVLVQWQMMAAAGGHDDDRRGLVVLALGVLALLCTVAGHLRAAGSLR